MQWRLQQFGLTAVIVVVLLYIGYRTWLAGGPENLVGEFRSVQPSPSVTVVPSTVPVKKPVPTVSPPISTAPQSAPTGAAAVLFGINERRAGSVVLQSNAILAREAQEHASDMARRTYFDHTDPDGITFATRMAASGYPSGAFAENLGLTSGNNAAAVVGLWMESPGHRENMLNPDYRAAGIGIATGTWQGRPATFVVAIFGDTR